jgi:aspartate/methionine/tyrosine aminotransferase
MRDVIRDLAGSQIREVANAAMGRDDVLAFWFGESDEVTPPDIRAAAAASLAGGETFYAHNLGLPALREAVSAYMGGLHPRGLVGFDRLAVTSSGVNALMVAQQCLVGAGDEVVAVVPVWPNLVAQPAILGARVRRVALRPGQGGEPSRWGLDLDELLAAITPATTLLVVNAPNNPTGWSLDCEEQAALLAHCRRTGTWILADEVYERLYYQGEAGTPAPSFLDQAGPQDRLVVVQSFSKSFLMTGWRLGWLVAPPALIEQAGKLIEFNTSCAPVFVQRAGLAALESAAATVPGLVARMRAGRDRLCEALGSVPGVSFAVPHGGMYVFLRVGGEADSLALAKRLATDHGLGLAPGVAFGPEAEGWLRWCFASKDPERLAQGVQRLRAALHT